MPEPNCCMCCVLTPASPKARGRSRYCRQQPSPAAAHAVYGACESIVRAALPTVNNASRRRSASAEARFGGCQRPRRLRADNKVLDSMQQQRTVRRLTDDSTQLRRSTSCRRGAAELPPQFSS